MTHSAFETSPPDDPKTATRLCFGGSFNPIHNGHLRCAQAVAIERKFGGVVLIPSAQPPHKPAGLDLAPAEDRLAMAQLAAISVDRPALRFFVDDLELRRPGPSYTIDTARELRARGWPKITWLIGADMLNFLPHWHRANELIEEVNFLIVARPGLELKWEKLPSSFRARLENNVVPAPLIDISATDIRRRARAGESIGQLVPQAVAEYIAQRGLYRNQISTGID